MSKSEFVITKSEKKAVAVALVLALIGGAIFLKPYFSLLILSIILAFLFFPVYEWLLKRSGKSGSASVQTFVFASLAVLIPVTLIIFFSVKQIDNLLGNADFDSFTQSVDSLIASGNDLLAEWGIKINSSEITVRIQESIQALGQSIVSSIPSVFSGVLAFITSAIIFIYVFLSLLKNNKTLIGLVNTINPLGQDISGLYMQKMSSMTKASVRGQFIIAFCQGLESALVLSIAGYSELFFFFLVLLTALSVIPMGAGIVTLPLGVLMILTGQVWQGILVIANHLLIVTNIDNVLRPILVPKEAKLDPALMILAVFSGVAYFGFMGIVLGPVIMIVVKTTIDIYLEVYKDKNMERFADTPKKHGVFKRASAKARNVLGTKKQPKTS